MRLALNSIAVLLVVGFAFQAFANDDLRVNDAVRKSIKKYKTSGKTTGVPRPDPEERPFLEVAPSDMPVGIPQDHLDVVVACCINAKTGLALTLFKNQITSDASCENACRKVGTKATFPEKISFDCGKNKRTGMGVHTKMFVGEDPEKRCHKYCPDCVVPDNSKRAQPNPSAQ